MGCEKQCWQGPMRHRPWLADLDHGHVSEPAVAVAQSEHVPVVLGDAPCPGLERQTCARHQGHDDDNARDDRSHATSECDISQRGMRQIPRA